jgi:hypothetical protein
MGSDKIRNHPLLLASGYQNIHTDAVLQIAATITRDFYQFQIRFVYEQGSYK